MRTIKGLILTLSFTVVFAAAAAGQTLVSLDGTRVNVNAQRGKVVVLSVGADWLPLSAKQADYTNTLVKKYAGRDVVFYFVATDSLSPNSKNFASNDDLRKFATANKLTIPILRDPDGAGTYKKCGIDQVPSFVILDKNGVQSGPAFGGIDPKYDITIRISKEIDKLLL
jgi:peroxiredoxin